MTDPYIQPISRFGTVIAAAALLAIGVLAALFAVVMLVGWVRLPRPHTSELLAVTGVAVLFGLFAAVLCTAGYRLLFRPSAVAGSMLPRPLWLLLCVLLGALAVVPLAAQVVTKHFDGRAMFGSVCMVAFSWWCYRFSRRNGDPAHSRGV